LTVGQKTATADRHADRTAALMAEVHQGIDHGAGYIRLDCSGKGSASSRDCRLASLRQDRAFSIAAGLVTLP
jgi:hypothetical protein